jgi:FlaG/FlaF family flagellin (archaellin)
MMNIRTSIKITGIVTALISAFVFIGFRALSLDKSYIKYRIEETANIRKDFNSFFTARDLAKDHVSVFLKTVTIDYPDISMIVIKGEDGRPILMSENNRLRADKPLYEEIREDVFAEPVMNDMTITNSSKYYLNHRKFYLLSARCGKGSLSLAFPRKMPLPLALRLAIETILVVAIVGLFFALAYIIVKRRNNAHSDSQSARDGDIKARKGSSYSKDAVLLATIESIALDLNAHDVILSFIEKSSKKIERSIGYKNRRLYSSLPQDPASANLRREIIDELSNGSLIIRNKGKHVIAPIFKKKILSGIMIVSRPNKFSGSELRKLEHHAAGLAHDINI